MSKIDVPNVLVVDNEKIIRDFMVKFFKFEGVNVKAVESGVKAIELASEEKFEIIFLDIRMPVMDGIETLKKLKKIMPSAKYVMMTGYAVDDLLTEAEKIGIAASVKKPFNIKELSALLKP